MRIRDSMPAHKHIDPQYVCDALGAQPMRTSTEVIRESLERKYPEQAVKAVLSPEYYRELAHFLQGQWRITIL